jgi:hypothetical protein
MKRIPSSFKVVGHTVKVSVVPASKWTRKDCVAYFDPEKSVILIKRRSASLNRQAFWHEAIHAALSAINHKLYADEVFVDNLGGLIAQILETAE